MTVPMGPNDQGQHAYRAHNDTEVRAPCPALNALANHSYLPHDGRNITFSKIVTALREGMGLSHGFAIFMAIGTYLLLRRPFTSSFDLHEAGRHNFIEHDASMVHDDTPAGQEYAPIKVNLDLLHKFLLLAHPSESSKDQFVFTADNIAEGRVDREHDCTRRLDRLHAELGRAEFAMVMEIFGNGKDKETPKRVMEIFLKDERFPPGWKPTHVLHLWEPVKRSNQIREIMAKLEEVEEHIKDGKEEKEGWVQCVKDRFNLAIHRSKLIAPEIDKQKS